MDFIGLPSLSRLFLLFIKNVRFCDHLFSTQCGVRCFAGGGFGSLQNCLLQKLHAALLTFETQRLQAVHSLSCLNEYIFWLLDRVFYWSNVFRDTGGVAERTSSHDVNNRILFRMVFRGLNFLVFFMLILWWFLNLFHFISHTVFSLLSLKLNYLFPQGLLIWLYKLFFVGMGPLTFLLKHMSFLILFLDVVRWHLELVRVLFSLACSVFIWLKVLFLSVWLMPLRRFDDFSLAW